jgi:hypothetical protein
MCLKRLNKHLQDSLKNRKMKNKITYYPVGNGDQSLITLTDGTNIMIDCNIRQSSIGSTDPKIFDVKKDLLKLLRKRNNNYYTDVFILTHGDCDHCRGYKTNFYQGDPTKYAEENRKAEEIIVDEMWFSPMIAEEHTNNDEDAYQIEAERRLALHLKKDPDKDLTGNRIKIIGYDGNIKYDSLNHLRAIPGTVVREFNNKIQRDFSVFIHAPFKEQLLSAEKDKNTTSIVFQARFKHTTNNSYSGLAMFGGDADYIAWGIILQKTIGHKADVTEKALDWDLFLAPHHCSWTYFNDVPQEENKEPKEDSLEILRYRRVGGKIIASSKKVVDDDDNPPHYAAKQEYIKKLDGSDDFYNTSTEPKEAAPEPLVFEITDTGIKKAKPQSETESNKLAAALAVASTGVIKKPWSY